MIAYAGVSTGYSGTPLAQKLGIKAGHAVGLLDAPAGFEESLAPLPPVRLTTALGRDTDVIVLFCRDRAALATGLPRAHAALAQAGGLWVAWPKRSSGLATDLTEDGVRELALPRGLVDNKVCAIDATWSGLRLVIRKELRQAAAAASTKPAPAAKPAPVTKPAPVAKARRAPRAR